jgi:hypothetical protein
MSPPSSRSKNKPRKKSTCHLLHADFLLGLFLDPEDGGDMFLFNDFTALYPTKWTSFCIS